ncbi:DUF5667 domain-containing protein [Streptomyces cavernae]|uniref:DUF5667 domain-containing protein n=1 Tax=Streptomyces cavernae TaxID=2259034 RepID=UPI000FEB8380|nr:DUF5667 domain-containing protein [Streptomyces cavernae]
MIANVSAHRRANAFAQALEQHSDRGPAAEQSEGPAPAAAEEDRTEQSRMLALATGLGALPRPGLDPEVKVVQRARLVAAMEAMLLTGGEADPSVPEQRSPRGRGAHRATGIRKLRPRSRLSKGLAAGGLTVGVAAGALSGVAAASSDALPGDSLYGLKRGMEDLKRGMADGENDRGRLYLDQASTRLSEARRLMERGRAGQLDHESLGEVRRALTGMRHDAAEGHRLLHEAYERDGSLSPIQALSAFSQSHRDVWGDLSNRLPVQLGDVRDQVDSVFDAIDQEVDPLRSQLPQPPVTEKGGTNRPGAGRQDAETGSTGSNRPTPSNTQGSADSDNSSSSKPRPSTSGSQDDGLLGGSTGGLVDPPTSESSAPPSSSRTPTTEPDVTVPPLLPGLLPGLGIDDEASG